MDLRQLAALTAVADCGTFSAAAEHLHTVQSNVSAHVARLERQLGSVLVDRAAGCLTEEGTVVVARARRIQAELDAMVADVLALRHEVVGDVRVGIIGTVARWLFPLMHAVMSAEHPKVRIVVVEASTTSLVPQLLAGTLSLAIVNLPVDDPDVVVTPLFDESMIAVVPESHPLSQRDELFLVDLCNAPVLLPPRGVSYRPDLDRAAAAAGLKFEPVAEIDGVRLITSLAFDGAGIGVVPTTAAPDRLSGAWRAIPVPDLPWRHVGLVQRRRGLLPAPARALAAVLPGVLAESSRSQPGVLLAEQIAVLAADGSSADRRADGTDDLPTTSDGVPPGRTQTSAAR
jgi:DNA-binding transcriptional LysR family regulator